MRQERCRRASGGKGRVALGHRRDVMKLAVAAAFGALFDRAAVAALNDLEVDLSEIRVGQQILINANGIPVLVWHRPDDAIRRAKANLAGLRQPEPDEARVVRPEWLVVIPICPHERIIIHPNSVGGATFYCPYCASRFDESGRILQGPAERNLPLPVYTFAGRSTLLLQIPVVERAHAP